MARPILSGWAMIEVFDTTAARIALARRRLGCPGCGQPLRPWGHARERTVRDLHGALLAVRPDRALCTGCGATHVVLDAGLLPRRAYTAGLIGQALVASALGHGHRPIAVGLAVPAGTVRGWIRAARQSAVQLRVTGIRAVLASGQDHLLSWARTDELVPRWSTWRPQHWSSAAGTGWSTSAGGRGSRADPRPAADHGPGRLSRPRRSRLPPARSQQSPPRNCRQSGTSPTGTGTSPTTPPEMPGFSSAS
jgi:hypothetical protein